MKSNKDSQLRTKDNFKEIYLASCDEEMAAKLDTFGRKWVVFLSVFEFLFAIPIFLLFDTEIYPQITFNMYFVVALFVMFTLQWVTHKWL